MTAPSSVRRLDPDELARLEEERDHLLSSLEDLEAEHDAGDMDDLDYETLRDDYTRRAGVVLRAIDEHRSVIATARQTSRRPGRTIAIVAGTMVFALVAGVVVAQFSGQRGSGTLTGNDPTVREQLSDCQATSRDDPGKGVDCYAAILKNQPDNVEALTYQGWAYIRDDDITEGGTVLARAVELDPNYPDARVFRAIVATRAGDFATAAAEIDRFFRNKPSQAAVSVLEQQGLERTIFFGSISPATAACWQEAAKDSSSDSGIDQAFLNQLGGCLDGVLATSPVDVDATFSRALAAVGPDSTDLPTARRLVDQILAAQPQNGNALLLRASLALAEQRLDDAQADLATLASLPRPSASFLVGSLDQLDAALSAARQQTSGSTTTAPGPTDTDPQVSVSTVPGAPQIPNVSGG
ncbi:MAG: tetratricopeptide repeat protein [Acidimicrobiales bacterium]